MNTNGMTMGGKEVGPLTDIEDVAPIEAPRFELPTVNFWSDQVAPADKVRIINPEDVPIGKLFENLGLTKSPLAGGFGTANQEELFGRSEILGLLVDCPEFRQWVLAQRGTIDDFRLPTDHKDFLCFYDHAADGHNPYWKQVHDFCRQVREAERKTGKVSARLSRVVAALEGSVSLERAETQMAAVVRERVEHIAAIAGVLTFKAVFVRDAEKIDLHLTGQQVHGYLRFSSSLAWLSQIYQPNWRGFWGTLGNVLQLDHAVTGVCALARLILRRQAMKSLVLTRAPHQLVGDVRAWLAHQLRLLGTMNSHMPGLDGSEVQVGFKYDDDGLVAVIVGIEPRVEIGIISNSIFDGLDNRAHNFGQKRAFAKAKVVLDSAYALTRMRNAFGDFCLEARRLHPELFKMKRAQSPQGDAVCKWYALSNLYQSKPLRRVADACNAHRAYFRDVLVELRTIAQMVDQVSVKCRDLGLPLCVAEPLPDTEHRIEFDGIVPVHLLDQLNQDGKKAVPLSLPSLNGEMICLTGKHGGGKTTTLLSVLVSLYMVQSIGLAFGKHFRYNPKRVLASLLIDRGHSGSTIELILRKLKLILEAAKDTPPNQMVAVIDELGSATQEVDGDLLGRRVLKTLTGRGVSVITATQIQKLAWFAKKQLGAITCCVDREHAVHEGISDGGLSELCEEEGVDRLLEDVPV